MKSILMLEHDEDDRYITQAVFDELRYNIRLDFVNSSDEFFAYLDRSATHSGMPSLILLNYYSKSLNALEVLKKVKREGKYTHIPMVVLSGTVKDDIVRDCYANGASSYIQKPSGAQETNEKIMNFVKYWFETVALP